MSRPLKVFKISHDELEVLLPVTAFENLNSALPVVCRAMCNDERFLFDEAKLCRNFQAVLQDLTLSKPPVVLLRDIREWALECLLRYENSKADDEIFLGHLPPLPSSTGEEGELGISRRVVTARHARGILANAFFANCMDVMQSQKKPRNEGGLDWRPLLLQNFRVGSQGVERMRCHMLYFDANFTDEDLERRITFERIQYKPVDFSLKSVHTSIRRSNNKKNESQLQHKEDTPPPVGHGVVLHNNVMEYPTRECSAFVNFANSNFGYGKFIPSCTQEEILVSCCPEITVGLLFIGEMEENEVVNVLNIRRFSQYSGYLRTFRCLGPIVDEVTIQDILTMDACYHQHFTKPNIQRDLNKAYASFRAHAQTAKQKERCRGGTTPVVPCCVSTGKWGCGAFGGLPAHKFLQQVLAAHLAGVDIEFSAYGTSDSCDVILNTLEEYKPSSLDVANALFSCSRNQSFVQDFQAALKT